MRCQESASAEAGPAFPRKFISELRREACGRVLGTPAVGVSVERTKASPVPNAVESVEKWESGVFHGIQRRIGLWGRDPPVMGVE